LNLSHNKNNMIPTKILITSTSFSDLPKARTLATKVEIIINNMLKRELMR